MTLLLPVKGDWYSRIFASGAIARMPLLVAFFNESSSCVVRGEGLSVLWFAFLCLLGPELLCCCGVIGVVPLPSFQFLPVVPSGKCMDQHSRMNADPHEGFWGCVVSVTEVVVGDCFVFSGTREAMLPRILCVRPCGRILVHNDTALSRHPCGTAVVTRSPNFVASIEERYGKAQCIP